VVTPEAGGPEGMLAKCRVADLLDIEINSVQRFKSLMTEDENKEIVRG
jgi:hypothetical protein